MNMRQISSTYIYEAATQTTRWMADRLYRLAPFLLAEVVVCWLLNVPATCYCISGTDLLRQFYVLPH